MSEVERRNGLYGYEYLVNDPDQRRKNNDNKLFNIKQLWQSNHEIINLAVRGFKQIDIADILNITPETVSNTINSDLGQLKIADLRKSRDDETRKVQEKIRVLTDKALRVYDEIFEDESGECNLNDKKKVADTVLLELSGHRAATKIQSTSASYTLSKEDLQAFKDRALAAAQDAGIVIDVKAEEVKEIAHDSVD